MEYNVNIKEYEGPMDLLVDLIKKNEIDIYDIPIHTITTQFLDYINQSKILNMEITSDFILMASTLIEIKSKMLLPLYKFEDDELVEDTEDPRKELVEKILEYNRYKQISKSLKESVEYENKTFYKFQEDFSEIDELDLLKNLDVDSLYKAFRNIILSKKSKEEEIDIELEKFSTKDASNEILSRLEVGNLYFSDLLEKNFTVSRTIVYFLSLLELIKLNAVLARQTNNFSDIEIIRRPVSE